MNNLALRVYWTNSPMSIQQKIQKPEIVLDIPFGNVLILNSGTGNAPVRSVNSKTGDVVLNAEDVKADQKGSANTVKELLSVEIQQVKALAETNELNLSQKVEIQDFEVTQEQIELNRLAILTKADIQALAQLTLLVDTKADQSYVNEQIAQLVGSAPEALDTIYELATALQNNSGLIEGLNQSVANRVRFDVATQALTEIQKQNARTNIGAEKLGTAQQLISQITAQSLGAASAAQGAKADTALQSADVAPVALTGLFSSLGGQGKIFDVLYTAYIEGTNSIISASDSLGAMLGKLQAQINAKASEPVWVRANQVGTIHSNIIPSITVGTDTNYLEFAKIGGLLWVRGGLTLKDTAMSASSPDYITSGFVTFNNNYKMQALEKGGAMKTITVTPNAFTTDGSLTRALFWSDRACMNQTQANTAIQTLCSTSNLYANSTLRIFPTCIGVLIS